MVRKHILLSSFQNDFLKNLGDLTVSEHIRRAIDSYIHARRLEKQALTSLSPSKKGKSYDSN